MHRQAKQDDGVIRTINTETFPEEVHQVLSRYETFETPTRLMLANEKRARRLRTYETNDLNKVSPAITSIYKVRKEALPHEQIRTSFVE